MSVEKVTVARYRCVCELPDCPGIDPKTGKGRPWLSKDDDIPKRCSWCKRQNWHKIEPTHTWTRVRKCLVCGGIDWTEDAEGTPICVHCSAAHLTAGPKKQPATAAAARPRHAAGCTCLTCKLQHEQRSKPKNPKRAAIELPKPKKVRDLS